MKLSYNYFGELVSDLTHIFQGQKATQPSPIALGGTGLRYLFYKPNRGTSALIIFNGCRKDELNTRQLADDVQPQEVVQPDVYVEDDYLVFADFHALDSLKKELNGYTLVELKAFENKMGFKSAFLYRKELLDKADKLSESEIENYLDEVYKLNYFDKDNKEFKYPFYNESYAKILNPEGRVKIGKTYYRFENNIEILTPDLTGLEIEIIGKLIHRKIISRGNRSED